MPGKRWLLTAVLGLMLSSLGCCRMCERWCGPQSSPCYQPQPVQQCCPVPSGSYYPAPTCPPGCVPAGGAAPVPTVPVGANWARPDCCK